MSSASPHSTAPTRLHGLDTLRALAIVLVMLFHLNMYGFVPARLVPLARVGWVGVDLFFVLSGFLIGAQLMKPMLQGRQPSLRDFYTRRAFRILPAFSVVLLLYMAVPLWRESPGPYAPWQYATFLWNLLLLGYPEHRAFSHVWSLCVEEHFYLVFPVLLLLGRRRPATWKAVATILGLVLGGVLLRAWLLYSLIRPAGDEAQHRMMQTIYYPTYSRLDGLVLGVALALLHTFRPAEWARLTTNFLVLLIGGLSGVLGALWMCAWDYPSPDLPLSIVLAFPLLALGFSLLVAAAVAEHGWLARRLPGAGLVANLAFSLYLTHKSVAHAVHLLLPGLTAEPGWVSSMLYLVGCTLVAAMLYLGVERPMIALRTRRLHRSTSREIRLDPAI